MDIMYIISNFESDYCTSDKKKKEKEKINYNYIFIQSL